jgi:hypothetical protein
MGSWKEDCKRMKTRRSGEKKLKKNLGTGREGKEIRTRRSKGRSSSFWDIPPCSPLLFNRHFGGI